jgi:hypothetical protein
MFFLFLDNGFLTKFDALEEVQQMRRLEIMRAFVRRVLRKISGPKWQEETEG